MLLVMEGWKRKRRMMMVVMARLFALSLLFRYNKCQIKRLIPTRNKGRIR